jgi:hypothetical protein
MPESCIDPNGTIFTFGSAGLETSFKAMQAANEAKMAAYSLELGSMDLFSSKPEVQKRIAQLNALINMHQAFRDQLKAMDESPVEFHLSNNAPQKGQADTRYVWADDRIEFRMGSGSIGSGILAHELRHGYGHLVGELSGSKFDDPLYDMTDEVVAYKIGALFWSESDAIKFSIGSWGVKEFAKSIESDPLYANLKGKETSLSISAKASDLLNYQTDGTLNAHIRTMNNPNLTIGEALSSFNKVVERSQGFGRYLWGDLLNRK